MTTVVYRGSKKQLLKELGKLPGVVSGRIPDRFGVGSSIRRRMGNALLKAIRDDYEVKSKGGTGRDGVTWTPLSKRTLELRRQKGNTSELILRDTGETFDSLRPGVADLPSGEPQQIFSVPPGEVVVGTEVEQFVPHQRGEENLPARPVWPVAGEVPEPWLDDVSEACVNGMIAAAVKLVQIGATL